MRNTYGETRTFGDGDIIFTQGEPGDEMYVVTDGAVRIFRAKRGREVELATLRSGEAFGELALLLDEPRSASARAVGDTMLRAIDRRVFGQMTVDDPLVWDLLTTMGERILRLDEQLSELDVADQVRKEHITNMLSYRRQFV
jgi:CRP-like cAMP-binding protein